MTDYNDGKIHGWNGGPCPVHPLTEVRHWMRDGGLDATMARSLAWDHFDADADIIAFQVITPYAEPVPPKTIWVNEYFNGQFAAHRTEDSAKKHAGVCSGRIAVKYVEVKE